MTRGASSYSLSDAAALAGLHYMTLYRQVRSGALPATVVGGAYRIEGRDLEAWRAARGRRGGGARPGRRRDWRAQAARLAAALGAGDAEAAWLVAGRLVEGGADAVEVLERVLTPALVAIGEGWERGELSVADEHRATRIASELLGRLGPRLRRPGRRRGTAVTAAVCGNRHGFAASLVAAALRADAWLVHDLGADVPHGDLAALVARERADLVCLSFARREDLDAGFDAVAALRAAAPAARLLVGGRGCDARGARALGCAGPGHDLATARELARGSASR